MPNYAVYGPNPAPVETKGEKSLLGFRELWFKRCEAECCVVFISHGFSLDGEEKMRYIKSDTYIEPLFEAVAVCRNHKIY